MQSSERPRFLRAITDIVGKSSNYDFLDSQELDKELECIVEEAKLLVIYTDLPHKESAEYNKLNARRRAIKQTKIKLIHEAESFWGTNIPLLGAQLLNNIEAADAFLTFQTYDRQRRIGEQHGFLDSYERFVRLSQFGMAGEISIKIGGVSIKDAVEKSNLPPASIYRFLMEAGYVEDSSTHEKVLQENQTSITTAYPNATKLKINKAARQIISLASTPPSSLDTPIKAFAGDSLAKEIFQTAKMMAERISHHKQKIYNAVLNPNSPDFPLLKQTVEEYLAQDDEYTKTIAILNLGLNKNTTISHAYRRSKEFVQQDDENTEFYTQLANSIRTFVEEIPSTFQILTRDALPSILDADFSLDGIDIPTLEDLRKQSLPLSQKPLRSEYSIDPQNIDWKNLIPPTSVNAVFPKGHSRIFNISLSYENEQGEALNLDLEFDTAKNVFDWKPFLESPDDPEMKDMKNTIMSSVRSILLEVEKQVDSGHQEKQRIKVVGTLPLEPNVHTAKPTPKEEYVPRKKEKRQKRQRLLTPLQEVLQNEISLPTEQVKVKNQIVIPDMQGLGKKMSRLSPEDTLLVVNGIEEYNQRGVGQFKRLRFSGGEREPLFTLRVNCGAGGGIRVLMHEIPNTTEERNLRTFEIVDIDYRKNIYRKRGL